MPTDATTAETEITGRAHQLLARIRGEYLEMPGMRLTPAQARRLWGLDTLECEHLLDSLVLSRFLKRTADGAYQRP
jgi:hypothetical protein